MSESLAPDLLLLLSESAALYDLRRALAHWPASLALVVEREDMASPVLVITKDGQEVARFALGQEAGE